MNKEIQQASWYTLRTPQLQVMITNYGARLLAFEYQGIDCICGPKTREELAADTCYCGSICGRVANRIAGARFYLGGREYPLAANNGPNHLHGGNKGFSDRLWNVEFVSDIELVLSLCSPDGDEGYPGQVNVRAVYRLEGQTLSLQMEAESDAPTPLNLTNHAYWNLLGTGTVDEHDLQVNASAYTPMVSNIPTGVVQPVDQTPYDLRQSVSLGNRYKALSGGFDDNYVLPATGDIRLAASLSCASRTLLVYTDAPGLQVYTGDYLPKPRSGVALEAQHFPDSIHHPHFPSIVLQPGECYRRLIRWEIA